MSQAIFARFKEIGDKKKFVYDDDLTALVEGHITEVPETWSLDYLSVTSGNQTVPTATVRLQQMLPKKTAKRIAGRGHRRWACGCGVESDRSLDQDARAFDGLFVARGFPGQRRAGRSHRESRFRRQRIGHRQRREHRRHRSERASLFECGEPLFALKRKIGSGRTSLNSQSNAPRTFNRPGRNYFTRRAITRRSSRS